MAASGLMEDLEQSLKVASQCQDDLLEIGRDEGIDQQENAKEMVEKRLKRLLQYQNGNIDALDLMPRDDKELITAELWNEIRCATNLQMNREGESKQSKNGSSGFTDPAAQEKFMQWYMEEATMALGEQLNQLRNDEAFQGTERDMQTLITSLQIGSKSPIFDDACQKFIQSQSN